MSETKELAVNEWMTVDDVAGYLGVKKSTVYSYVSDKKIEYYKKEGVLRFKKESVDGWLESGRVPTHEEYLAKQLNQKD